MPKVIEHISTGKRYILADFEFKPSKSYIVIQEDISAEAAKLLIKPKKYKKQRS